MEVVVNIEVLDESVDTLVNIFKDNKWRWEIDGGYVPEGSSAVITRVYLIIESTDQPLDPYFTFYNVMDLVLAKGIPADMNCRDASEGMGDSGPCCSIRFDKNNEVLLKKFFLDEVTLEVDAVCKAYWKNPHTFQKWLSEKAEKISSLHLTKDQIEKGKLYVIGQLIGV